MNRHLVLLSLGLLCAAPLLAGTGLAGAATPTDAGTQLQQPERIPVLAKVESREFLFNRGLSAEGAMAVDRVRYEVEVLDPRGDTNLAQGHRIKVDVPGGCVQLLQPQASYLVSLQATGAGWTADCIASPGTAIEAALVAH